MSCRGVINSVVSKSTSGCPIAHCYTAVGHSKAVLSLFAIDDLLFTGSKGTLSMLLCAFSYPNSGVIFFINVRSWKDLCELNV